jgi:hypothetical protein
METTTIVSCDIDPSRFSMENLNALRAVFSHLPDEELARYLIARNDDVHKAMEQIQKAQKVKMASFPILKDSVMKEMMTGKLYCHGEDKDGRPLIIWNSAKNIASQRDLEETSRLLIWWTEYTIRKKMPGDKSKYTILINRTGHSHENSDIELMKHTAATFQVSYMPFSGLPYTFFFSGSLSRTYAYVYSVSR